ncbi:MAG: hypothetical protein Q7R47_00025, partial [Candidatus Diapherotrites archaeon]|nr:hypothetical protein [Candidatus Diapherotrites archaeon]
MKWTKQQGITFALVGKRFDGFDAMSKPVTDALARFADQPLVIVFPEAALGEQMVGRAETKEWMLKTHRLLQAHPNAFVFFSVFEKLR